jgi:hypothetical protein
MGKTEPLAIGTRNAKFLSLDLDLGDVAGCPLQIRSRICDLMPFVLFGAH